MVPSAVIETSNQLRGKWSDNSVADPSISAQVFKCFIGSEDRDLENSDCSNAIIEKIIDLVIISCVNGRPSILLAISIQAVESTEPQQNRQQRFATRQSQKGRDGLTHLIVKSSLSTLPHAVPSNLSAPGSGANVLLEQDTAIPSLLSPPSSESPGLVVAPIEHRIARHESRRSS